MTETEILLLAAGFALGAQTMAIWHMVLDMRHVRRNLDASRQIQRRAAADRYLNSLRLYRLPNQPRPEPHPAELLEASARGFELKLYDSLDRVEDALRRDGQL